MQTQLLGQIVRHPTFGAGTVTSLSGNIVTVRFVQEEKNFLYPEAFSGFLTLEDAGKQAQLAAINEEKKAAWRAKIHRECAELERFRKIRNMKISPKAQAVFSLSEEELAELPETKTVSTGCYLSGYSKGEPRIPSRIKPNTACLLTVLPGEQEAKRQIVGVFMVPETFWGEKCRDGLVPMHPKFSLMLPREKYLSYFDYFPAGEKIPAWGRVSFKYFANTDMESILWNIRRELTGTEQAATAAEFYSYFCKLNHLQERS